MPGESLVHKLAKNASRPMRFQYSVIVNIWLIDQYLTLIFGMQINMNEKKNKAQQQVFWKNSHLVKWAILGPKIVRPHNSGTTRRIFLTFCSMKGADKQMGIILIFQKKMGQMDYLGPKMVHPHNPGSTVRIVLNFAQ